MQELVTRLNQSDAQYSAKVYDAEFMKWLLDRMCLDAGVDGQDEAGATLGILLAETLQHAERGVPDIAPADAPTGGSGRSAVASFLVDGVHPTDIGTLLDHQGVATLHRRGGLAPVPGPAQGAALLVMEGHDLHPAQGPGPRAGRRHGSRARPTSRASRCRLRKRASFRAS